jgi:acyl carrier protein
VREGVVVARTAARGEAQLVAYVVGTEGTTLSGTELRQALQSQLPAYMLPAALLVLEALPRLPNGKVDREALPAPQLDGAGREQAYVAPRTPIEAQLAQLWAQVLGLSQVGVHDNFFALGGDSITTLQIKSYVHETFQIDVPLQMLFEQPTIAQLAEMIYLSQVRLAPQQIPVLSGSVADEAEEGVL